MNKPIPLWLVICLLVVALLPTVYLIGREHGQVRTLPARDKALTSQSQNKPTKQANNFTHFRVGNRNVKSILTDGDIVWVGTSGGVIRYDIKKGDYSLFDVNSKSLLSNGVFHLSKLNNQLFVGTYGGGLSIHDTKTNLWRNVNIPDGLADQFVYDIEHLANGDMWIATWSGVNRVRGGQLEKADHWLTFTKKNTQGGLPNDWVYGVEIDTSGGIWFATEEGVARFANGIWQNWQHNDGLGAAYELVKDNLRFSNDPASASRHHAKQKMDQGFGRVKAAYNPNYVVALEITPDDTVWAGTWGGGLARFDGRQWHNFTDKEGLPSNHVFSLYLDPNKDLWVGTSHGLAKYLPGKDKFKVFTKKHGLFADNVFSMSMAKDGSLWAGSFGGVAQLRQFK